MPTVRHHDPSREENDTVIPGVREQGSRDIGSPACGSRGDQRAHHLGWRRKMLWGLRSRRRSL